MKPEEIRKVIRENYPRFCTVVLKNGRRYRTRMMWCLVTDREIHFGGPKWGPDVPLDQVARVLPPRRATHRRSNHRPKAAKDK